MISMIGLFIIIYIVIGIIAGLFAGFFGLGGGLIFVPILITTLPYFNTGANLFHVVLGTSLMLIIPSGVSATYKQIKLKNLDYRLLANWLIFIAIGAVVGIFIVNIIPSIALQIAFAIFMIFVFLYSLFKKQAKDKGDEYMPSLFFRLPVALFVGFVSTFFGLGGGLPTTILLMPLGYPIRKCTALSSCSQIVIGIIGGFGLMLLGLGTPDLPRFSFGYVNWFALVCLGPTVFLFAPLGVAWANKISDKWFKRWYKLLIFIIAVYVVVKTCWSLFW